MTKMFVVTRMSRQDVKQALADEPELARRAWLLTDDEMKQIARKMEDDYCNQLFWSSLRVCASDYIKERRAHIERTVEKWVGSK
jgi:hypothetical protein